jgi:hypothetical protein
MPRGVLPDREYLVLNRHQGIIFHRQVPRNI